ncbi:hypothetical protein NPIL_492901 [Nephila pilipes]|uniref:Uncharacterized protein n=1 Tax=Nephila pilipes TaxID=299642 RepID=A0A8X6NDD4_NEPPI|nr:hypothetical protein NPIL_492901 [Nephila pilipes]
MDPPKNHSGKQGPPKNHSGKQGPPKNHSGKQGPPKNQSGKQGPLMNRTLGIPVVNITNFMADGIRVNSWIRALILRIPSCEIKIDECDRVRGFIVIKRFKNINEFDISGRPGNYSDGVKWHSSEIDDNDITHKL